MENEYDKDSFVKQPKKKVRLHGQKSFYAIIQNTQVLNLLDHHHKFTVEEVINQYKLWCKEPDPELDQNTG